MAELMSEGAMLLTTDDVLPNVADLIPLIQVEAHFLDGTKLVSIHNPIRPVIADAAVEEVTANV